MNEMERGVYLYEVDESSSLITLELLKAHLAIDHDQDDLMLARILKASQSHVEDLTMMKLYDTRIVERYRVKDLASGGVYRFVYRPFIELTGYHYANSPAMDSVPGSLVTDGNDFTTVVEGELRDGIFIPGSAVVENDSDYVFLAYRAGVSSLVSGQDVLKQASLLVAASMYEMRESEVSMRVSENPMLARLLANYKVFY